MSSTRPLNNMHSPSDNVRRIDRIWRPGVMSSQYQSSAFHIGMSECFSGGVFFGRVAMIRSSPSRMFVLPSRYAHPHGVPHAATPGELCQIESGSAWCVFLHLHHAALFAACRGSEKPRAPGAHASVERERTSNRRREGVVASVPSIVGTDAPRARL